MTSNSGNMGTGGRWTRYCAFMNYRYILTDMDKLIGLVVILYIKFTELINVPRIG